MSLLIARPPRLVLYLHAEFWYYRTIMNPGPADPPPTVQSVIGGQESFDDLARAYRKMCGIVPYVVDDASRCVLGHPPACGRRQATACLRTRLEALSEALRWGEPTIGACGARKLVWAIPIMQNQTVLGAVVACVSEKRAFTPTRHLPPLDVRRAASDLRTLAEERNLTNAAALELQRSHYLDEQQWAYSIHDFKASAHHSIRELYLREEPALFSAIRSGDRPSARAILNRILVEILQSSGERIDLMKSFFLELVVSMSRTAVESGGQPENLLGASFRRMTQLARIRTEEELAPWLGGVLEHLMDEIQSARAKESPERLFDAIAYMQRHCCERITRDDAARAAHVSGSHFSFLLRRDSGATFTDLLNRMRTDRAAELLVSTHKPLSVIAVETGFNDQSYFTKVFKRNRNASPLEFRRTNTARPERPAADQRP
jgi:AraC-like DNA-binding protein